VTRFEISIEIADGPFSAQSWQHAYGDRITSTAVEHGAVEWRWIEREWGIVCEIAFAREKEYERWRALPGIDAAFDAVPDPVAGLIFHRGWGGTSGSGEPRRPRPVAGAGAAELEFEDERDPLLDTTEHIARLARAGRDTRSAAAI